MTYQQKVERFKQQCRILEKMAEMVVSNNGETNVVIQFKNEDSTLV